MDSPCDESLTHQKVARTKGHVFGVHLLNNVTLLNIAYFRTLGKGHSKHLAPTSAVSALDILHAFLSGITVCVFLRLARSTLHHVLGVHLWCSRCQDQLPF